MVTVHHSALLFPELPSCDRPNAEAGAVSAICVRKCRLAIDWGAPGNVGVAKVQRPYPIRHN